MMSITEQNQRDKKETNNKDNRKKESFRKHRRLTNQELIFLRLINNK